MKIKHGAPRSTLDRRDYSFHKTFPHFGNVAPAELPLMEYTYDAGLTMADQNAEGIPFGCTGECQGDCKSDQDKEIYDAADIYKNTCMMEGHDTDRGCDIRNSAKSLRVYGAKRKRDGVMVKSGLTFSVDRIPGRDWFDSFRIALRAQAATKTPISVGTIWFLEWENPEPSGLLSPLFAYDGNANEYEWHNYAIKGEQTVNGEPTFLVKSWQGKNYGHGGWVNMDRATFNRAFDIYGTIGITVAIAHPDDIQTIDIDILQTVLDYLRRILNLIYLSRLVTVHS